MIYLQMKGDMEKNYNLLYVLELLVDICQLEVMITFVMKKMLKHIQFLMMGQEDFIELTFIQYKFQLNFYKLIDWKSEIISFKIRF